MPLPQAVVADADGFGRRLETLPLVRDQPNRVTLERLGTTASLGVGRRLIGGNSGRRFGHWALLDRASSRPVRESASPGLSQS